MLIKKNQIIHRITANDILQMICQNPMVTYTGTNETCVRLESLAVTNVTAWTARLLFQQHKSL